MSTLRSRPPDLLIYLKQLKRSSGDFWIEKRNRLCRKPFKPFLNFTSLSIYPHSNNLILLVWNSVCRDWRGPPKTLPVPPWITLYTSPTLTVPTETFPYTTSLCLNCVKTAEKSEGQMLPTHKISRLFQSQVTYKTVWDQTFCPRPIPSFWVEVELPFVQDTRVRSWTTGPSPLPAYQGTRSNVTSHSLPSPQLRRADRSKLHGDVRVRFVRISFLW